MNYRSCHTCRSLIFSFLFWTVFLSGFSFAQGIIQPGDVLSALEKKYAGKSFSTRFSQISRLAALDITENAAGKAWFSHPGKMHWAYQEPNIHQIITNGKTLWIFRPDENQVMTGDARRFFTSGAGGAFLSDISLIRKNFHIKIKAETEHDIELDLANKDKTADITAIIIRISKANYEIKRLVTYNRHDDTTLFEFYEMQIKPLDPGLFEFNIPAGVNVIEMSNP